MPTLLRQMGMVDIAGCGPVHVVGGTAALVAAWDELYKNRSSRKTDSQ